MNSASNVLTLIPIEKLNEVQFAELLAIVSDRRTMANIGNGRAWNEDKLQSIKTYSASDNATFGDTFVLGRDYYYWAIVLPNRAEVVGMVGLHPLPKRIESDRKMVGLQIVIAIAERARGQGFAQMAIDLVRAKNTGSVPIWILTSINNIAAQHAFEKIPNIKRAKTNARIAGLEYVAFELPH